MFGKNWNKMLWLSTSIVGIAGFFFIYDFKKRIVTEKSNHWLRQKEITVTLKLQ